MCFLTNGGQQWTRGLEPGFSPWSAPQLFWFWQWDISDTVRQTTAVIKQAGHLVYTHLSKWLQFSCSTPGVTGAREEEDPIFISPVNVRNDAQPKKTMMLTHSVFWLACTFTPFVPVHPPGGAGWRLVCLDGVTDSSPSLCCSHPSPDGGVEPDSWQWCQCSGTCLSLRLAWNVHVCPVWLIMEWGYDACRWTRAAEASPAVFRFLF